MHEIQVVDRSRVQEHRLVLSELAIAPWRGNCKHKHSRCHLEPTEEVSRCPIIISTPKRSRTQEHDEGSIQREISTSTAWSLSKRRINAVAMSYESRLAVVSSEACTSTDTETYRPANRSLRPAIFLFTEWILVGTATSVCCDVDIPAFDKLRFGEIGKLRPNMYIHTLAQSYSSS